ncbi:protein kinase [Catenulispora sp. NF23]|uniref:serine/threonine protein kinase n=1 Tax=Catenulispora pinistramenti TaxID=2705254 RepID=UPI001BAD20D6|nr:serine/threonine protein kinase [Catenulispora pinistramenti]MBS2536698.1 protein kinase [Catenulispora pinistramenti]
MAGLAEPGRLIGGRYRLRARLGSGGMGRVWLASDESLRIDVAVKEVWLPATPGPDSEERLRRAEREARNAARLRDHPNVVAVHDVVVDDGVPWTVMQLVAGHTLEEHVEEYGPLSVAHAAIVAAALLDALEAAHAAGIVHRDVKPANVMLADDGKVLLTDFGIAIGDTDTALTAAGTFLGSVEYIAPERARGTEGLAASDLFSLGVTLFQAVEGFSPFHRETATGTLTAVILDEAPEPMRAGRLTPLVTGLLEKDPVKRLGIGEARRALTVRENPSGISETLVTPAATAPRGTTATPDRGATATPARRPGEADRAGSGSQGTDQRRRTTGPQPADRRRRPDAPQTGDRIRRPDAAQAAERSHRPDASQSGDRHHRADPAQSADRHRRERGPAIAEPRRPAGRTGTGSRVSTTGPGPGPGTGAGLVSKQPTAPKASPAPKIPRTPNPRGQSRPARRQGSRGVILAVLVAATIAGVLVAVLQRSSSFDVTSVHVGDFVRVDKADHIIGKVSQKAAADSADGRRVLAREDQRDPAICRQFHDAGHADVEVTSSVSFCLIHPNAQAAAPQQ